MVNHAKVKIIKKPQDVLSVPGKTVLRASIGGTFEEGYYIVYRGEVDQIREMMIHCLLELTRMKEEPQISPEDGRHQ
jgi:hypothetical protein